MDTTKALREIARLDGLARSWARARPIVPQNGTFDDIAQCFELVARYERIWADIIDAKERASELVRRHRAMLRACLAV